MDLLKNHYEKIILGVVLLGVVVFTALLPGKIAQTQRDLKSTIEMPAVPLGKPATAVDLAPFEGAMKAAANPAPLVLSGDHNLFNPIRWRKIVVGQPIKPDKGNLDVQFFQVTAIRPLAFAIWFDAVRGSGSSMRYQLMILNEASISPSARRPIPRTIEPVVGKGNEIFTVTEIRGPLDDPNEVVLELKVDKQVITVGRGRERGYQKNVGYEADATFKPANRNFKGLRVGHPVPLSLGETWKVIAIDASTVTIESKTLKRETKQLATSQNP